MYALGFDIGGTKIEAIVKEQKGIKIKEKLREKVPSSKDEFIKSIIDITKQMNNKTNGKIVGIGISIAGSIDHKKGIINVSPNLPALEKLNLKNILEKELKIPAFVDNDAKCFALSEQHYGAGIGYDNFMGIILGTGFGGAIVANGKIIRGKNNIAGEIGHTILVKDGHLCGCGQKGCAETYISGKAVEARYKELAGKNKTAENIFKLQDQFSKNAVEEFLENLKIVLVNITNLIDPEAIIFGGGLSNVPYLLERLKESVPKHTLNSYVPELLRAKLGDASGVFGAAALVFEGLAKKAS